RSTVVQPASLQRVEVNSGKDRYTRQRRDKTWTLGRAPTDSGAVARLLERYRSIVAASFASAKAADSTRAMRPTRRLALRDARGALLVALSFDSTGGGYIVRRTGGTASGGEPAAVYRLNTWDVDGLTPAAASLLPTKKEEKKK